MWCDDKFLFVHDNKVGKSSLHTWGKNSKLTLPENDLKYDMKIYD